MRASADIHSSQAIRPPSGQNAAVCEANVHTCFAQLVQNGVHIVIGAVFKQKFAVCYSCGYKKGSCFNAIRHNGIFAAMQ